MTNILLYIRSRQIIRELNGLGLYIFFLIGLLWFLMYVSFKTYQKTPNAYFLTAFLTILCLWLQSYRKDKEFIYQHIDNAHLKIYSEYIVLSFPFAISSLLTANWICFPVLLILLFFIPFFKFHIREKTYFKNISRFIPATNFEWISGFRKSFMVLMPLYILALCFSWFRILPLFILWFITVSIISFYNECEPLHILKEGSSSAKEFLTKKLLQHSKYMIFLYTPIIVINTIFNTEYLIVNLLFIPMQISLLCLSICLKYSSYIPNQNSIGNNIILSLIALCSVIPYLLPIPLIMTLYFYWKAKNNLEHYLND